MSFGSVFHERMRIKPGEMIVQVHVPIWALSARYSHIKKTANEKIDYPLVSVAALWKDDTLRIPFSGVSSYPFRSEQIEYVLNARTEPMEERIKQAVGLLPEPASTDAEGSGEYRFFVLENALSELLEDWGNDTI